VITPIAAALIAILAFAIAFWPQIRPVLYGWIWACAAGWIAAVAADLNTTRYFFKRVSLDAFCRNEMGPLFRYYARRTGGFKRAAALSVCSELLLILVLAFAASLAGFPDPAANAVAWAGLLFIAYGYVHFHASLCNLHLIIQTRRAR
jgi:hypothetical protein